MLSRARWLRKPPVGTRIHPSSPLALSGLKGLWLLNEGSGTSVRDLSPGNNNGTFATDSGSNLPVWQTGPIGSQVGGFGLDYPTDSRYIKADSVAAPLTAAYPFWVAVLASNTNIVDTTRMAVSCASNVGGSAAFNLVYTDGSGHQLSYGVTNNSATHAQPTVNLPAADDGQPHLVCGASYAANDHRLFFDGDQVATDTTSVTASFTVQCFTLGANRKGDGDVGRPFDGSILWAAVGQGAVPNFAALWAQFWAPYQMPNYRRWFAPAAATYDGSIFPWITDPAVSVRGNPLVMIPY